MKIKDCFITHKVDDIEILISLDTKLFSGLVKLNETAAVIVNLLKQDTNIDDAVSKMLDEYQIDEETIKNDVNEVIDTLKQIGALDE